MTHQRLVSQIQIHKFTKNVLLLSYDSSKTSLTNSNSLSQSCQFSTHVLLLAVPVYFFTDKTKTKKKLQTVETFKHMCPVHTKSLNHTLLNTKPQPQTSLWHNTPVTSPWKLKATITNTTVHKKITEGRGPISGIARQKQKKQKYELERGEKFLRFTRLVCDYDQGFEE